MKQKSPITKAAFARELGLSRQRIGQYCEDGMPQRADGMLDLEAAMRWLRESSFVAGRLGDAGKRRIAARGYIAAYASDADAVAGQR